VVRLLAVVLAVAGAGVAGRAPQAFRAWTDTAAEVARAGQSRRVEEVSSVRAIASRAERQTVAPVDIAPRSAVRPATPPTHAWPGAGDLRQLLALKQSRLI
jgi:hypothetical protein